MTSPQFDADVLIVGAGPVGLSMAMDLAARGAKVLIAEIRAYKQPPEVKCNHIAARTMERFRRLGVAQKLRNAGLPADFPNDVAFRTTATGMELTRIPIPGHADRYTSREGPDTWWPTPEPAHRINQTFMEPILVEHTAALPNVTLLNRTQVMSFTQDDSGVDAVLLDLETKKERRVRARYLVGCDGGSSMVRKAIGAKFEGTPVIQQVQSTFIRAPKLLAMLPRPLFWSLYAVNPRRCGSMFAIDGKETWLIHNHLNPGEPDFDSVDRDWSIRQILGVDDDFEYEVISKEDWVGRRLVATRFRDGKVFIAGDAAHLWVPYAGYGMNAGIADGLNLSWLLGAVVQGWAGEAILDAYEAERQPITQQVSNFAMEHAAKMIRARSAVPPNIEALDEAGQAERDRMGREAYDLNVQQFAAAGLNFGYYYENSPIIIPDGESPPPYSMGGFTASTVPGCRAPHFWLKDGTSLYDAFGWGYTLMRFDPSVDADSLVDAASQRAMPLKLLDIEAVDVPAAYRHKLLVVRDDQHVAWRGDAVPADARALVDRLGGSPAPVRARFRTG